MALLRAQREEAGEAGIWTSLLRVHHEVADERGNAAEHLPGCIQPA